MAKFATIKKLLTPSASASTAVHGSEFTLPAYEALNVFVQLTANTGGALDVYIQSKVEGVWVDVAHFAQLAAGGAAVAKMRSVILDGTSRDVGTGDKSAVAGLAADTFVAGPWGQTLRLVSFSGASTSVAGSVAVTFLCHTMSP